MLGRRSERRVNKSKAAVITDFQRTTSGALLRNAGVGDGARQNRQEA